MTLRVESKRGRILDSLGVLSLIVLIFAASGCSTIGMGATEHESTGDSLIAAATRASQEGRIADAARAFEEARERAGEESRPDLERLATFGLARSLFTLGDLERADEVLEQTLDDVLVRDADGPEENAALNVASVEGWLLAAEIAAARSDDKRFESSLDRALEASGDAPRTLRRAAALRGQVALDRDQLDRALQNFETAIEIEGAGLRANVLANQARALVLDGQLDRARGAARASTALVGELSPEQWLAYLHTNLSQTWIRIAEATGASVLNESSLPSEALEHDDPDLLAAERELQRAEEIATAIGDPLALSYVFGYRSRLLQTRSDLDGAVDLAHRAVFEAARAGAPESESIWTGQVGRLHALRGERTRAIDSYGRAVALLEALRAELTRSSGSVRRFRDEIAPIYTELVDLLLQEASAKEEDPALMRRARAVVERFKVAELRDYFRDECVDARANPTRSLDEIAEDAVVLYPIPLADRLELLITLPGGQLLRKIVPGVGIAEIERAAGEFRRFLTKKTTRQYRAAAQQLYTWLIAPFEEELAQSGVSILITVPGAALRGVPFAALHDGKQYLIERYAIATAPSLELVDPRPIDPTSMSPLLAGLSVEVEGFRALPHVGSELAAIQSTVGGEVLLDNAFGVERIEERLREKDVNLLHLATHAEFKERAADSYLLAWDGRVTMDRLADYVGLLRYREEPLDLIVLSACETAEGDDRAALGLSGVAIRAGARSAIGTLWSVNDAASARLIQNFYRELVVPGASKASALQRAQLELLSDPNYEHAYYWAAFLLINGWR